MGLMGKPKVGKKKWKRGSSECCALQKHIRYAERETKKGWKRELQKKTNP